MAKVDLSNEVHALEIYRDQMRKELDSAAEWKKNWGFITETAPPALRGFQQISVKYSANAGTYTNARVSVDKLEFARHFGVVACKRVLLTAIRERHTGCCELKGSLVIAQKRVPDNSEEGMAAAISEQKSRNVLSSLDWQVQPARESPLREWSIVCYEQPTYWCPAALCPQTQPVLEVKPCVVTHKGGYTHNCVSDDYSGVNDRTVRGLRCPS